MKHFFSACRIFVGVIFVISGLIKANDPLGFSYKMEEYFTVFKLQDSITNTVYEMRELSQEEIAEAIAGTLSLTPTDYNGNIIDLTQPGAEEQFMYVKESRTETIAQESKHWFNDLCDLMHEYALALSLFMCILEVVLGVLLLAGYYVKATTVLLFLLIVFFGFLTFYSAYYNKVTDCGCFGDALKLTPWQSFWKDAILGIFVLPLLFDAFISKRINGHVFDNTEKVVTGVSIAAGFILSVTVFNWYFPGLFILVTLAIRVATHYLISSTKIRSAIYTILVLVLTSWFSAYCINHLPIKDYRPWAKGNILPQKMISEPEWADVYMVYKNKQTGEIKEFLAVKNTDGKPKNDWSWLTEDVTENYEFQTQRKEINKPFKEAPIHDFTLDDMNTGEPYSETFIFKPGYKFMLVTYDLGKANTEVQPKVNAFADAAIANGFEFIAATSSRDKVEEFSNKYGNKFPYHINDATSLKTIIRSNPGLVLLKDTAVVEMWHYNDFPDFESVRQNLLK